MKISELVDEEQDKEKYSELLKLFGHITVEKIIKKGNCRFLRSYLSCNSQINKLFDEFSSKYLLSFIKMPEVCENDHCYWDYDECEDYENDNRECPLRPQPFIYVCNMWICREDYEEHTDTFTCTYCQVELCRCNLKLSLPGEKLYYCFYCHCLNETEIDNLCDEISKKINPELFL